MYPQNAATANLKMQPPKSSGRNGLRKQRTAGRALLRAPYFGLTHRRERLNVGIAISSDFQLLDLATALAIQDTL
jgi:hypothetical protein